MTLNETLDAGLAAITAEDTELDSVQEVANLVVGVVGNLKQQIVDLLAGQPALQTKADAIFVAAQSVIAKTATSKALLTAINANVP